MSVQRRYNSILSCLALWLIVCIFLSLALYNKWPRAITIPAPVVLSLNSCVECNKELCNGGEKNQPTNFRTFCEEKLKIAANDLSISADVMSQLDPSYRNTMTKLGTDFEFSIGSQCPADSYMLDRTRYSPPQHTDCPTLFIVGVRKGGTTSLYQYVSKHPDFQGVNLDAAGAKAGELFYFNKRKLGPWKGYHSHFSTPGNETMITGESSVAYLAGGSVPKRLYRACGKQAKVVMLLRDPIKRMESDFLMLVKLDPKYKERHISSSVKHHIRDYKQRLEKITSSNETTPEEWSKLVGLFGETVYNMIFQGFYYVHLQNWLCNFPAENILILNSEEFFEKPITILDIVFQFLDLTRLDSVTYKSITSSIYNERKYDIPSYQKLSQEDVSSMVKIFKPFNKRVLELLQWDNHKWLMD